MCSACLEMELYLAYLAQVEAQKAGEAGKPSFACDDPE